MAGTSPAMTLLDQLQKLPYRGSGHQVVEGLVPKTTIVAIALSRTYVFPA
jgi:hypothetical protein